MTSGNDGNMPAPADELLIHQLPVSSDQAGDGAENWFDRFYQCLCAPSGEGMLVAGAGIYPNVDAIDGYACLIWRGEQRNLRFADRLERNRLRSEVGPLSWDVVEPMRSWRTRIGPNPEGFELDATWTARARPWMTEPVEVDHSDGPGTAFAHYFQPGRWHGKLTVDGDPVDLEGWTGPRDRSWGVRRARERLGMHLWIQAQFEADSISVHYNEYRDGTTQHREGALIADSGETHRVRSVTHDFELSEHGEFLRGEVEIAFEGHDTVMLSVAGRGPGLYMAGAGYGGWHGQRREGPHLESERWPLDGSHHPGNLPLGLADKACDFHRDGEAGAGILELALTRSRSYTYRPSRER